MNWYLTALKQYATFEGRARRKEYWYFALGNFAVILVLGLVDMSIGTYDPQSELGLLSSLYILAVFLPSLGVTVRRLHDIGRSGWWVLVNALPVIGWIVQIVFACTDSQPGANKYGPNPKGVLGPGEPSPEVKRD